MWPGIVAVRSGREEPWLLMAFCLGFLSPLANAAPMVTTFDVPGATETDPWCINTLGAVAGDYEGADGSSHGFIRAPDGTITKFDPPGSTSTEIMSIDGRGTISGNFLRGGVLHGFIRSPDGKLISFDPPGSIHTTVWSRNGEKGLVVGYYNDNAGLQHGFTRDLGGKITVFDAPGSSETFAYGVNSSGTVIGTYLDGHRAYHGFLRDAAGNFTTFDAPGASSLPNRGTFATAINNAGVIVGGFSRPGGNPPYRAFIRSPDGTILILDVRRETGRSLSVECAVNENANGDITSCYDQLGRSFGFIRTASGAIQKFKVPGSYNTVPLGINNHGAVTGYFLPSRTSRPSGFIRSP